MKKKPLTKQHAATLSEYGLHDASLSACACHCFQAGETMLQEGLPLAYLYLVVAGRAKVCQTAPNGRNLVLCYYVLEGILGDVELMTNTALATSTVIAITDFECLAIPFHRNAAVLKQNNEFMNRLGTELAEKLVVSSGNYVAAALNTCEERLCSYILQTSHNGLFNDILSDTACSVGMSYRHMFRILNQLCMEEILEKKPSGYRILNREALIQKARNAGEWQ